MVDALSGFVIVGLPIALGYLVARLKVLASGTGRQLNLLVFYVLIPFMLFHLFATSDVSVLFSRLAWICFGVAAVVFVLYALIAGVCWRRGIGAVTVGALASGYTNAGNIGLPVALHFLGDASFAAPVIVFQTCVFAPIALVILHATSPTTDKREPGWKILLSGIINPVIIGSFTGVLVSWLPWDPPDLLLDATNMVGQAAVPLMLIAFGMSLRGRTLLASGPQRSEAILACLLKIVAMPLIAFGAGLLFGLDPKGLYVVTTLAALPTAQNVFNYATRYDQSVVIARDAISITTLAAAPLLLLITLFLG
jgi:predicted permease